MTSTGVVDATVTVLLGSVTATARMGAVSVTASISGGTFADHPTGLLARLYQTDGAAAWALATPRSRATLGFYGAFEGDYRQVYA